MFGSWKLGRAFGIDIFVHWTFMLLPAYLVLSGVGGSGETLLFVLTLVAAVFGCVVLHELGHSLTARRFGIETRDITLYPIGGVARLERMSERPWEEFWIALAGPAVNVVIAALLGLVLVLAGPAYISVSHVPSIAVEFAFNLLVANIWLVGFNLLPAFPMDGGRVFRAVLAHWLGRLRATEIAATVAVVVAVGLLVYGLRIEQPFLVFGALFVFLAGRQELAAVRLGEHIRPNDELSARRPEHSEWTNPSSDSSPAGFTGFRWDARARGWVYWQNGRPVQVISTD